VVSEGAKAAVVVSASYPHTILHLNNAWLDEMMPDYMHTGEKSTGMYIYAHTHRVFCKILKYMYF
jgi:hypothetical protein